jgi:hypothetical protein
VSSRCGQATKSPWRLPIRSRPMPKSKPLPACP